MSLNIASNKLSGVKKFGVGVALLALIIQPYVSANAPKAFAEQAPNAGEAKAAYVARNAATGMAYTSLPEAVAAANAGDTLNLTSNIILSTTLHIPKKLKIVGGGYTLSSSHTRTNGSTSAVLSVEASGTTVTNLTISGGQPAQNLHGIVVYQATDVDITDVSIDSVNAGVIVNSSAVDVSGLSVTNARWGGINVDLSSGQTVGTSSLTISGANTLPTTPLPAIWTEKPANAVITDVNHLYTKTTVNGVDIYALTPATPDTEKPVVELAAPQSVVNLSDSFVITATDNKGLKKIVGNIYDATNKLARSTQSAVSGTSATHTVSLANLAEGEYKLRYNALDTADNLAITKEFAFRVDTTAPKVTVKKEMSTSYGQDMYAKVSYKLFDSHKVASYTINGKPVPLSPNTWSDANNFAPNAMNARIGRNTLVVSDVAGNETTVTFTLVSHSALYPTCDSAKVVAKFMNGRKFRISWNNGVTTVAANSDDWTWYSGNGRPGITGLKYAVLNADDSIAYESTPLANPAPCASTGYWANDLNSFWVKAQNYPDDYKVKIYWEGGFTETSMKTVKTTGWWSGNGRSNVSWFNYEIYTNGDKKKIFTSDRFTVDRTAPQVVLTAPKEASSVSGDVIRVEGTFTDATATSRNSLQLELFHNGALVEKKTIDGSSLPADDFRVDFDASELGAGEYSLFYTATDMNGNASARTERVFTLTKPDVSEDSVVDPTDPMAPDTNKPTPDTRTPDTRTPQQSGTATLTQTTATSTTTDNTFGARPLVAQATPVADTESTTMSDDAAVLGSQVAARDADADTDSTGDVEGASTNADTQEECAKFLGICWYWWIPIVIIAAIVVWRLIVAFRRRDDN